MNTNQSRLAAVILGVVGTLACAAGEARAQCSAWANTMGIAANLGGEVSIIHTSLSNGEAFIFFASTDGFTAFTVGQAGLKQLKGWAEDEFGTAKLVVEDDPNRTCLIACDNAGGITVTIAGDGFDTLYWNVKDNGKISMPGDVCACSGSVSAPSQNARCSQTACNATSPCRTDSSGVVHGYCQAGSVPNNN